MRKIKDSKILLMAGQIAVLVLVLFGVNSARGFTEPSTNPPGGNVEAPVNTGSASQVKTGSLTIGVPPNETKLDSTGGQLVFSNSGGLFQKDANGDTQVVLRGRDSGNSTQFYIGASGNYYMRDVSGNIWQQVTNGSTGIGVGATPNPSADLTLGTKGLSLSGITRNEWPRWADYADASYKPQDKDVVRCPAGHVLTGLSLTHGSGDKEYFFSYRCREITGMYAPSIPVDPPAEKPEICVDDGGNIITCPE